MSDKKQVHHLMILDESGSMDSIRDEVITGYNEIVQQIQSDADKYKDEQEHYISLVAFNGEVDIRLWGESSSFATEISEASYIPSGSTAMNDAIATGINKLRQELEDVEDFQVFVTIITDGHENASREFSSTQIKSLIKDLDEPEDSPWIFNFIGANIDSITEGGARGIRDMASMNFDQTKVGTQAAFSKLAATRSVYSAGLHNGLRKNAMYEAASEILSDSKTLTDNKEDLKKS